jgi:hypothetical protein
MDREYSITLIGYIIFGVGCVLGGIFLLLPMAIFYFIENYHGKIIFGFKDYIFVIGVPIICIMFLISDAFLTVILTPFICYWKIVIKEDGIYGYRLWEVKRLLFKEPRKLCNWDEIKSLKRLGLFDMRLCRTEVKLKNGRKFYITNAGNTPADITGFYTEKDERERNMKYSSIMMYALIMKRIGEDKFKNFEKGRIGAVDSNNLLEAIKVACIYDVDYIIEEDRKRLEKLKRLREQWAKEEEENKNGQEAK